MALKTQISELESHVGFWLRFASNHVSQAFARKVEGEGVTVAEWVVLRELYSAGATHPSQLAERLGMTRGAISKLVERLCKKQLAQRTASDDDARFQSVSLTASGTLLTPKLARLADENDREHFGHLDAAERDALLRTLQGLVRRHGWKNVPMQ
jgi:DNA-binding MarR family transcriptional regulator